MLLPNPTNKVGGSFILSLQKNCPMLVPNPTNEVGGLFILSLQRDWARTPPKSHQRSWWIVHTQPTKGLGAHPSRIPPTQLVDRSYSAYKGTGHAPLRSEEHTSELQSQSNLVCRLLLEKKKKKTTKQDCMTA